MIMNLMGMCPFPLHSFSLPAFQFIWKHSHISTPDTKFLH